MKLTKEQLIELWRFQAEKMRPGVEGDFNYDSMANAYADAVLRCADDLEELVD